MRSSKSRSRNKSNRQRTLGNIVNRVFDSSGPEGKVRGTPQQIIEKYLTLARDAQLSNDRVAEQSFLQHAEHYTRMLGEAQREQAERLQNQQQFHRDDDSRDGGNGQRDHGNGQNNGNGNGNGEGRSHDRADQREPREYRRDDRQPAARHGNPAEDQDTQSGLPLAIADDEDSGPVATPEAEMSAPAAETVAPEAPAEAAPAPRRRPRASAPSAPRAPRSRKKPADADGGQPDKASGE
ncbi:DUF4167 domain-containing protein [Paracoccus mangrovi]|uniref:DUF4167 domain-containing protein n=1 Tax=Paracoccus mangrovi TaxID=1715645 RepID=A0ABV7R157_9RHOB